MLSINGWKLWKKKPPFVQWKSKGEWSTHVRLTRHNNPTTTKTPALQEAFKHFKQCQRRWRSSLQAADDDATHVLFLDMLTARRVKERVWRTELKRQSIENGRTLQKMLDNKNVCWWKSFRRCERQHDPLTKDMAHTVEIGLRIVGTNGFPCSEQLLSSTQAYAEQMGFND